MQFSEVIGQEQVKTQLVQLVRSNRLSHAFLFLGKEGAGGLSLARAFSQYIVCEKISKPRDQAISLFGEAEIEEIVLTDSCGECPACKKAAALIHPDIHFTFPVIPKKTGDKPVSADYIVKWREFISKTPYGSSYDWLQYIGAENRQGNITRAECEEILHTMSLKSFESGYKILIMWMPEALGKEGNVLLKLIEEPTPGTLFLFVAENESLIIPTIISRTQLIRIPLLSNEDITKELVARENVEPAKAAQVAMMAAGNYNEALSLLQHAEDDWEKMLRAWINTIISTGPASQVKWIEETAKLGREKQKQFIKYFNHMLNQAIRIRSMGLDEVSSEQTDSTNELAGRFNKICDTGQIEAIINELDKASYHIERNANAKILFHALTIRLYHIIRNKSVILVN